MWSMMRRSGSKPVGARWRGREGRRGCKSEEERERGEMRGEKVKEEEKRWVEEGTGRNNLIPLTFTPPSARGGQAGGGRECRRGGEGGQGRGSYQRGGFCLRGYFQLTRISRYY